MSQGSMVIAAEDLKGQCGMIPIEREEIIITKRSQQKCFRKHWMYYNQKKVLDILNFFFF